MVASSKGCTGACVHAYTILNATSNQNVSSYVSIAIAVVGRGVHIAWMPLHDDDVEFAAVHSNNFVSISIVIVVL